MPSIILTKKEYELQAKQYVQELKFGVMNEGNIGSFASLKTMRNTDLQMGDLHPTMRAQSTFGISKYVKKIENGDNPGSSNMQPMKSDAPPKYSIGLNLTTEMELNFFKDIDEKTLKHAFNNQQEWFKAENEEEQVRKMYSPLVASLGKKSIQAYREEQQKIGNKEKIYDAKVKDKFRYSLDRPDGYYPTTKIAIDDKTRFSMYEQFKTKSGDMKLKRPVTATLAEMLEYQVNRKDFEVLVKFYPRSAWYVSERFGIKLVAKDIAFITTKEDPNQDPFASSETDQSDLFGTEEELAEDDIDNRSDTSAHARSLTNDLLEGNVSPTRPAITNNNSLFKSSTTTHNDDDGGGGGSGVADDTTSNTGDEFMTSSEISEECSAFTGNNKRKKDAEIEVKEENDNSIVVKKRKHQFKFKQVE